MSAPWVFTPGNMEIIAKLRAEGASSREIARAIGSTSDSVRQTMRRKGMGAVNDSWLEFRIAPATHQALSAEAERRGVKLLPLIHRLLATIAKENLFTAILDDGEK